MFLSEWARKVDVAGKVLCLLCNDLIKYGEEEKCLEKAFKEERSQRKNCCPQKQFHITFFHDVGCKNETLCTMPYSAAANIHDGDQCSSRAKESLPKIVSFEGRLAHNDVFIVPFLAEHDLPFTISPNLIEFARFLIKLK